MLVPKLSKVLFKTRRKLTFSSELLICKVIFNPITPEVHKMVKITR